jgi:FMN phosphatase YigB (HAD superfamily)
MTVKILSDFDGVWTDQAFEAAEVKLYLEAEAARLAGVSADRARAHFERFDAIVKASPHAFGWAPDRRITAYVDEDPFCEANSIAGYIAGADGDADAARYREAVLAAGHPSVSAFADRCFVAATSAFRAQHPPALVPRAAEMLRELTRLDAEVVVVSNSTAEKIVGWFREIGVDARAEPGGELRVRGSAAKFALGPSDDSIEVGGRRIFVDRPKYRAILEGERPEVVIGDVFSLDLALPHVMRAAGHAAAPRELVLRRHPHTPRWVLDSRANGAIDRVVDSIGELAASVARLSDARR